LISSHPKHTYDIDIFPSIAHINRHRPIQTGTAEKCGKVWVDVDKCFFGGKVRLCEHRQTQTDTNRHKQTQTSVDKYMNRNKERILSLNSAIAAKHHSKEYTKG
jgi:hypothetical protein